MKIDNNKMRMCQNCTSSFLFDIGNALEYKFWGVFVYIFVYLSCKLLIINVYCGAGGIRTHVQTGKPYAFYTLILDFVFRAAARPRPPTTALSSKFHLPSEALTSYSRFICTADSKHFGTTVFERCLVPSPCNGIKLIIYYASIKQRERTYFRQLILW